MNYAIQKAGDGVYYMRMVQRPKAKMTINESGISYMEIKDIEVLIPLYGYSENRIEISNILKEYSIVEPGTYWKQN